jgi:stigma-specific protein Stig1
MDPQRFDALVRTLRAPGSRRAAVQLLASTLVAVGASRRLVPPAAAQTPCRTLNQKCPRRGKHPVPCCSGLLCHKGRCRIPQCRLGAHGQSCGAGQTCCAGFCVDLPTDESNCGRCGHACLAGEPCLGGQCVSSCLAGLTACNGQCVDVLRDPANCGGCGIACRGAASNCGNGQCQCPGGLTLCAGICVDTQTEPAHCGGCGRACPSGNVCQAGTCVGRCKDDGQSCASDAECCRFPESTCNAGVCGRRCSVYGGPCAASADCCETGPGIRPPCSGGTCVACVPYGQACAGANACCSGVPCNGGRCVFT